MTATVVTFQAGDLANATAALSTMGIASSDKVLVWQQNNQVVVCKVVTP